MKHKWLMDVVIAAAALALLLVWLLCFPPTGGELPVDTTPADSVPTEPSDPTEPDAPVDENTLSFVGKVLEVEGDSVLMDCYAKLRFDTVWVNVGEALKGTGITPQVGEEYTVTYEDMMMPSLPPRITAVTMKPGYYENIHPTTGELLYDGLLYDVIDAYPWEDREIPNHPGMSVLYYGTNLSETGYALIDLDGNGQKELVIGAEKIPFPYDAFTVQDGELVHLFTGHNRSSYHLLENGYIRHDWSGGATLSGSDYYRLVDGEMRFLERIALDADHAKEIGLVDSLTEDAVNNCYFRSEIYNEGDAQEGYRSISEQEAVNSMKKYNENKEITLSFQMLETVSYDETFLEEGEYRSGHYIYTKVDDGVEIVKHIDVRATHVEVPAEIDGLPVVALGEDSFYQHTMMKTVSLPKGLKRINGCCFYRCYRLQQAAIPATVTEIESNPFWRASSLAEIEVDKGNTAFKTMGGALYDITGEILIAFPEGKEQDSYSIPKSVKVIRHDAFGYFPQIKDLYFTKTVIAESVTLTAHPSELTLHIYRDSPVDRALQELEEPDHPYEYR